MCMCLVVCPALCSIRDSPSSFWHVQHVPCLACEHRACACAAPGRFSADGSTSCVRCIIKRAPQAVQAAQLTFEDFFMSDLDIEPMKIVGFEGLFGVIGTLGIMAPIAYFLPGKEGEGIHENVLDTFAVGPWLLPLLLLPLLLP